MTKFLGRYSPFLQRQEADLKAFQEDEDLILDPHMDYSGVPGISSEVKEKLAAIKPTTIVGGSTQIYTRCVHVHYRELLNAWRG
jgi:tRNA U34 5-carboxymethylaminomethyl modifying enzyme MnmG/GidA